MIVLGSNLSSSIIEIASCLSGSKFFSSVLISSMPEDFKELSKLFKVNSRPSFIVKLFSSSGQESMARSRLSATERKSLAKASTPNSLALVTS